MATIDLGKIKLVNRGAYNNSTAYTVDDLVQSGGTTYICIQNSTGNAVTNTSYWNVLAQKGTDGTDVGTTLTTQGDILYRDGSGLQRLAAGTSGQVLQTGGSGANPSWGTISSDFVKLGTASATSGTSLSIDGLFSSTYRVYKIYFHDYNVASGTGEWLKYRYNYGGSAFTGSNYVWSAGYNYRNSSSNTAGSEGGYNTSYMGLTWWGTGSDHDLIGEITIADPLNTSRHTTSKFSIFTMDGGQTAHQFNGGGYLDHNTGLGACSGLTIFPNSNSFGSLKIIMYGLKA